MKGATIDEPDLAINPVFISWRRDRIIRPGLQQPVVGVKAVDTQVAIQEFLASLSGPHRGKDEPPAPAEARSS